MKEWNERTKVAAATAFALAGLLVTLLAIFRPHWLFGVRSESSLIPLQKPYSDLSIFSNEYVDTQPTKEELERVLNDFSPTVSIPLRPGADDVTLDLQSAFQRTYDFRDLSAIALLRSTGSLKTQ